MIELRGVSLRRGGLAILSDVDLDVLPGECCALVGANGSGKTMLLRICAALLRPTSGQVVVASFDARREPRQVRARVGYVPQHAGRVDGHAVREEVELVAACHGIALERRRRIAGDLLLLTALEGVADHEVARLSPGQHRRLLLAGALVHDPAVLLLDAPDAGLDEEGAADLAALLRDLRDMGKTLLVAGSAALQAQVCDTEVVLQDGTVVAPDRALRGLPA